MTCMHARSIIYGDINNIAVKLGKYDDVVYRILSDPVTPNEIARKLGITQRTAQRVLMHLALTKDDVKYKNSGRIHIFWKENVVSMLKADGELGQASRGSR